MPDYRILIFTLGGLPPLGRNGFVIGPLMAVRLLASCNPFGAKKTVRLPERGGRRSRAL